MNDYYVYEWIRLDTNEPFYVGIGHGNRWKQIGDTRRNKYFMRVYNKHKYECAVHIIHDNLTKEIASDYECWYINEYKYIVGYDICNLCDGGEGMTVIGKNNPSNREVICINTGAIYYSLRDAEYKTKISYSGISQVCNGKRRYAGKDEGGNPLYWMYYDEYLTNNKEFKIKDRKIRHSNYLATTSHSNNTSGCVGVNYRKDRGKWRAYIVVNKKNISLGMFKKYEDAVKARKEAELKYYGKD